jgi:site-specific recombinase XerD
LKKEKEEDMTQANVFFDRTRSNDTESDDAHFSALTLIDHLLAKLSMLDLPAKEHFESYLRYKVRTNHKPKTIESSFTSVRLFLAFYGMLGKTGLKDLQRSDLEAFIEHEQDRGMHITTVKTRTACIIAFLHFLIEQELIPGTALKKRIRFKLPDLLPRAMHPDDVKKLLSIIDHTRNRALVLLLLRTGIRIGEALSLTMNDIDLKERKVHLYQGEKNDRGRVVYLSNDAVFSLKRWLTWRDPEKFVFSRNEEAPICYSTARSLFKKYLIEAGLGHKGYTVHCLRHYSESRIMPSI